MSAITVHISDGRCLKFTPLKENIQLSDMLLFVLTRSDEYINGIWGNSILGNMYRDLNYYGDEEYIKQRKRHIKHQANLWINKQPDLTNLQLDSIINNLFRFIGQRLSIKTDFIVESYSSLSSSSQ